MGGKRVAVVGLGLIGGSIAMALRGFEDYEVVGVVRSQKTYDLALSGAVCDQVTMDAAQAVREADVTWLCLPPQAILDFLETHKADFKPGSLVTDVCGIKTAIVEGARCLPDAVDFIGCHPMAGKEVSGLANADKALFHGAHFILTPSEKNDPAHVALLERMAAYMGFRDTVRATPEEHDAIIAYTSQVMHIMAVAVCDDPDLFSCKGFEGGSFRDCTRVAALDVPMWTELFSLNAPALCKVMETLEDNLRSYRQTIASGDKAALAAKLQYSADRKRRMSFDDPAAGAGDT